MPAPFEFPGHYWDEARQKFFKIETTGTAPAGAQWSREQVSHQRQRERLAASGHRQRQRPAGRGRGGLSGSDGLGDGNHRDLKRARAGKTARRVAATAPDYADTDAPSDGLDVRPSRACTRLHARAPLFGRETGLARLPVNADASTGRIFEASMRRTGALWFAAAVEAKGTHVRLDETVALSIEHSLLSANARRSVHTVPLATASVQQQIPCQTSVTCMYIHPDPGPPHLGILYTDVGITASHSHSGSTIHGQYIVTDDDYSITTEWPRHGPAAPYAAYQRTRPERLDIRSPSTISYSEATGHLIVTSAASDADQPLIQMFSPHVANGLAASRGMAWWPGATFRHDDAHTDFPGASITAHAVGTSSVHACAPSPRGAGPYCVAGTETGVVVVDFAAGHAARRLSPFPDMAWATSPTSNTSNRPRPRRPPAVVTSVDFVGGHPSLVVAGGRMVTPWLVDLRASDQRVAVWDAFRPCARVDDTHASHASHAIHVRSVGPHHVVAAGVHNTMVMYDLRYLAAPKQGRHKASRRRRPGVVAEPLFHFSNYYNADRMTGLGFAVDADLGIVAAAEEHAAFTGLGGGLGLFSLATGERLSAPHIGACHAPETLARIYPSCAATQTTITSNTGPDTLPGPTRTQRKLRIPALSFAHLVGEPTPSLFVAEGRHVHKFSP